jgi:hypothetical protein
MTEDHKRRRWRVRLYSGTKVRHRSYHLTKEQALETWQREVNKQDEPDLSTNCGQLQALIRHEI